MSANQNNERSKGWKEWVRSLLYAALFILIFRNFFFTLYPVRSDSMGQTVEPGDWTAVNLLAYGPRIPSTPVCVPFTPWYLKSAELPVWRIPGYSAPSRNDVVFFNYPQDSDDAIERKDVYVKRLIALPRDTVSVTQNTVFINGKKQKEINGVTWEWVVITFNAKELKDWLKKRNLEPPFELTPGEWLVQLSQKQREKLQSQKFISSIRYPHFVEEEMVRSLFTGKLKGYDVLNFLPTQVPYEGMRIELNPVNVQLYAHSIQNEGNSVKYKDSVCTINGKRSTYYVFNEDHYFMLGDARAVSVDSRHWGFVPRSHLVGRASFVFMAFGNKKNNSAIRWSKCLRSIQ